MFFPRLVFSTGLLLAVVACSPEAGQKDPVADAKFENEKRIGEADVTKKQERDAEFMVNTASSGLLEVELSKLAQTKASTPAVKTLADRMVQQHNDMSNALKSLADKKSITLPGGLGHDQEEEYKKLAALTGTQFDKQYVDMMVQHHKDDVSSFDDMSEDAYDGDIRGFAAKYLPTFKDHLDSIKEVEDQVKDLK